MDRTDVNPWEWSKAFGFSQAVELSGTERILICSGQTAIAADGSPPTTDDIGEQVDIAMANLTTVLAGADMTRADIVKLTLYTTDVDGLLASGGMERIGTPPNLPVVTLLGISRLAYPELKVEIEAIAVR